MAYILIKNLFDTYSSFRVMFGQGSLCKREQKEITPKWGKVVNSSCAYLSTYTFLLIHLVVSELCLNNL